MAELTREEITQYLSLGSQIGKKGHCVERIRRNPFSKEMEIDFNVPSYFSPPSYVTAIDYIQCINWASYLIVALNEDLSADLQNYHFTLTKIENFEFKKVTPKDTEFTVKCRIAESGYDEQRGHAKLEFFGDAIEGTMYYKAIRRDLAGRVFKKRHAATPDVQ